MQFFEKVPKNRLALPPLGLAPRPLESPGSASVFVEEMQLHVLCHSTNSIICNRTIALDSNLFIFIRFSGNIGQIIDSRSSLELINLPPSSHGHPSRATAGQPI